MFAETLGSVWEYRPLIQFTVLALVLLYALHKGDEPERSVAITLLAMSLSDRLYHALFPEASALIWHFSLDALACVALVSIGLFANRTYTLWIGSFQIIALSAHIVRFVVGQDNVTLPFAILYIMPSYFQIGLLLWGTHQHAARVHRFGPYRSWRNYSSPSPASGPRM